MPSLVRPELPTASVASSQAPTAAVDNSAPSATRPQSTYKSGKAVQTSGATSLGPRSASGYRSASRAKHHAGSGPLTSNVRAHATTAEDRVAT